MKSLRLPKLLLLLLLSCCSIFSEAQERVVSGRILDPETNTPLEGVSVKVKNSQVATMTNASGEYSIRIPTPQSVLTFSYVGYSPQELRAGTGATLNVSLPKVNNKMDEVVVVGYGTKKRVNVQGAVSTIKAAEI